MRLLSFNLSKISAERFPSSAGDLKIVPNVKIEEIKGVKAELKSKEELIGVKFSYIVSYDPDYAKLEFSGEILASVEQKIAKEILKNWKDKKLEGNFKIFLFNIILRRANLKALELEDELGLPLHIPLPSVGEKSFNSSKESSEKSSKKD